jgi:hypothetical protein
MLDAAMASTIPMAKSLQVESMGNLRGELISATLPDYIATLHD